MCACQKDNKRLSIFWNNRIRSIQVYWHRKKSGQNGLKKKKYSWFAAEETIKGKEERKSKNQLLIRSFLQVKAMTIATIDIGGTGIKFCQSNS